MTRDEHRAACIDIMEEAFRADGMINSTIREGLIAAFDALHGLVVVMEMPKFDLNEVARMLQAVLKNGEIRDYDDEIANRLSEAAEYCAMSATGDLTNPPD